MLQSPLTGRDCRCDIVHAHEWGGVFADLVMTNHFRQLQSGLRVAIEPHGGHVWSQLGEINRQATHLASGSKKLAVTSMLMVGVKVS